MNDCIFCKIASGEIPSNTVYEDDNFIVILDLGPANIGHCLVLPKTHGKDIFELDSQLIGEAHKVAKKTAEALKKAYNVEGINILQNNGAVAGQTVSHYHIHVIPRIEGDNVNISAEPLKLSDEDFITVRDKIKSCL